MFIEVIWLAKVSILFTQIDVLLAQVVNLCEQDGLCTEDTFLISHYIVYTSYIVCTSYLVHMKCITKIW